MAARSGRSRKKPPAEAPSRLARRGAASARALFAPAFAPSRSDAGPACIPVCGNVAILNRPLEDVFQHPLGIGDPAGDLCPVRRLSAEDPAHGLEQDAGGYDADVVRLCLLYLVGLDLHPDF